MLGPDRVAMLRLVGAIHTRWRHGHHPHLCAFAIAWDELVERVLVIPWLR